MLINALIPLNHFISRWLERCVVTLWHDGVYWPGSAHVVVIYTPCVSIARLLEILLLTFRIGPIYIYISLYLSPCLFLAVPLGLWSMIEAYIYIYIDWGFLTLPLLSWFCSCWFSVACCFPCVWRFCVWSLFTTRQPPNLHFIPTKLLKISCQ